LRKQPSDPTPPVRVLHLEDNEHDRLLVREMLHAAGLRLDIEYAQTRSEFESKLRRGGFDLIISDHTLPSYDGQLALAQSRRLQPDVPFIFFSATIGEELAVDSLKTGATDYVLKQRPARLIAAVQRALKEFRERRGRHAAEAALGQSEERFRIVSRATNDVIWDWDLRNNAVWRNESFQSAFGHTPESMAPNVNAWSDLIHPDDKERVLSSISATIASGGRVWWSEYRLRRADGSYAYVFDRASVIYDKAGKPVRMIGVNVDITERKQAEDKIREQASLLDKAQDAIMVRDLAERIIYWNHSAERIYGWLSAEAIGRKAEDLLFQKPSPQFLEAQRLVMQKGEWAGELQQVDRHGRTVIVQSRWTLVRDDAGHPKSKLVINTDVTARRQLEEQLLRAQRLESLGMLVGGIAHDLNNALVPVLIGAEMLKSVALPEDMVEVLSTMSTSAARGADMVQQVLTFARGGSSDVTSVRVDHLVKEMGRIIGDTFPKTIRCRVKVARDSWPVAAVATQLHQVLMNLCLNARDAMERGGTLTLSTKNTVLDETEAAAQPGAKAGRYLCLSVADTGAGIAAEHLSQIFQPFFTTKAHGKGTGLGLSTSLTIVKNHGGFVTVESKPGHGTDIKVFLPAAETPAAPEAPTAPVTLPAGNGEGILVVDDEVAILVVLKTSLENYGYRVFIAASGLEAVTLFSEKRDTIQLVITDVAMPFMDGVATVGALRKIRPDIPIIVASGSEQEKEDDAWRQLKPRAFLRKPFTAETLLRTVHEVLTKPA
jgi:PAS domain S-box-containing protein